MFREQSVVNKGKSMLMEYLALKEAGTTKGNSSSLTQVAKGVNKMGENLYLTSLWCLKGEGEADKIKTKRQLTL